MPPSPRQGLPPWHMWGGAQIIEAPYTGIFATTTVTSQLNRISYGRPESWNFFFYANIFEQRRAVDPPTVSQVVDVFFHLTIGIGRSSTTIRNFEHFRLDATAPQDLVGRHCFSASVWGRNRDDNLFPNRPNEIFQIIAQDIQLNADVVYSFGETIGDFARLNLDTYFAPVNHVRPEWFEGQFRGGEDHGS